jgi:(1->4)-alpha-D-glucan 1-alpha-D-glucosylmutase
VSEDRRTSWAAPNTGYEDALGAFVAGTLADRGFLDDLEAFVAPLVAPGRVTSLAQTLLKLTAPGVPDLYQGTERWDLTLVDPDNRRPVDYELRRRLLRTLNDLGPEAILARSDEGLPKLWVVRQASALRRHPSDLFGSGGSYHPVPAAAPHLVWSLGGDWHDPTVHILDGDWYNTLTGDSLAGGHVPLAVLMLHFPIVLLERKSP